MQKYTLYIGLNDKDTKTQLIGTLDAYHIITRILGVDSTITECKGVYTHDNGVITFETSLQVVLLDFDGAITADWLKHKVNDIKRELNQESVAVQREKIESELM